MDIIFGVAMNIRLTVAMDIKFGGDVDIGLD